MTHRFYALIKCPKCENNTIDIHINVDTIRYECVAKFCDYNKVLTHKLVMGRL